jgi:hypothetical protein
VQKLTRAQNPKLAARRALSPHNFFHLGNTRWNYKYPLTVFAWGIIGVCEYGVITTGAANNAIKIKALVVTAAFGA